MTVDDLRAYHGVKTDVELAKKLKKNRCVISFWRNKGIPIKTQAYMQLQSRGALVADLIECDN